MDFKLPSSAVAVLRVTYESLFSTQKLLYKDRRRLWKKFKRKKKRIINHFAILKLQSETAIESGDVDAEEHHSSLPEGPLTNDVIIRHLKSIQALENSGLVSILRNAEEKPNTVAVHQVETPEKEKAVEITLNVPSMSLSPHNTNNDVEVFATCEVSRPDYETNEITRLLAQLDEEVERWQNPSPPQDYQPPVDKYETIAEFTNRPGISQTPSDVVEDNRPLCSFYVKTGACRFGDRCSKKHETVSSSDTLVFPNMFNTFLFDLEDRLRVAGDTHDLSLEHSEQDLHEEFEEFYSDIRPEFQSIGKISQLYVCRNRCHHLRGNVYVQYFSKSEAKSCLDKMLGRYFGGKPLICRYVNISSWTGTLCGIDIRTGKCSRGGQCNYLHVFKIPISKKFDSIKRRDKGSSPRLYRRRDRHSCTDRPRSRKPKHKSLKRSRSPSSDRSRKKRSRKNPKRSTHDSRYPGSKLSSSEPGNESVSNLLEEQSSLNGTVEICESTQSAGESDASVNTSHKERTTKKSKKKKKKHKKKCLN